MKSKYQCPFCQYMSLKKWNIKKHVNNVHGIRNYPNGSIQRANIDHQNMRQPEFHTKSECPIHSSEYKSIQQHQQTFDDVHGIKISNNYANSDDVIPHHQSKYQPSQEEHQYGKRFKDASTQYSENDFNHSTIPHDTTNTADQIIQEKEAQLFEYYRNIYEDKSVENCNKRKPVVITSKGVFTL